MRVTVKTPEGDAYPLDVKGTDTIAETKKKIEEKTGRSAASQNLFYLDKKLEDSQTISSYGINFFATIRLHGAAFDVTITQLDGSPITVQVEAEDVLMTIHDHIQQKLSLRPNQYKLMLENDYIEDEGKSMSHYGIKDGSTLLLLPL